MRRIWWARPLYLLAVAPGLRGLFDLGYRTFARHRYDVSRVCRLEQKPPAAGSSVSGEPARPAFLVAAWRYLAMLNFRIDPRVLRPLVPAGTELDDLARRRTA